MLSRATLILLAPLMLVGPAPSAAADRLAARDPVACLRGLTDAPGTAVACELDYRPSPAERAELERITSGVLRDASCVLSLRLDRDVLADILLGTSMIAVPPQPVACTLVTNRDPLAPRFTVAPRVWLEGGTAVRAAPGLAVTGGLPPVLARLLVDWVNGSKEIQAALMTAVNNFLSGR